MIDVVNFQSFNRYNADVMGCTTFSFALNLGVYLTDVLSDYPLPLRKGEPRPEEYHCHIRRRLYPPRPILSRAEDIWAIDEAGGNLEEIYKGRLSNSQAPPFPGSWRSPIHRPFCRCFWTRFDARPNDPAAGKNRRAGQEHRDWLPWARARQQANGSRLPWPSARAATGN